MAWFDKGKNDASQNQGQQDKSKMTHQEKEKYDAGYNKGKQDQSKK